MARRLEVRPAPRDTEVLTTLFTAAFVLGGRIGPARIFVVSGVLAAAVLVLRELYR